MEKGWGTTIIIILMVILGFGFLIFSLYGIYWSLIKIINAISNKRLRRKQELFHSIKTMKVTVNQTYLRESEKISLILPFKEAAQRFLGEAGLKVVNDDAKHFDAILEINARGEMHESKELKNIGGSIFREFIPIDFVSGSIEGNISLKIPGSLKYKKNFYNSTHQEKEKFSIAQLPIAADTFFSYLFEGLYFLSFVLLMIGELFDYDIPISALKNKDISTRKCAAFALWELKIKESRAIESLIVALKDDASTVRETAALALGDIKDSRVIEPLIFALKDEDSNVRENAASALSEITKKQFGEDYDNWANWWEKNKKKLLKEK